MADEQDFAEFYRGAHPGLVAESYAYTGDLAEAQEAAQEAFTRAWPRWNKISSYDRPRAWVARVAYRLAVSRWRKARNTLLSFRRHGPPPDVPAPGTGSSRAVSPRPSRPACSSSPAEPNARPRPC